MREKMRYFGGKEKHFKKKLTTFEKKFFIQKKRTYTHTHTHINNFDRDIYKGIGKMTKILNTYPHMAQRLQFCALLKHTLKAFLTSFL